MSHVTASSTATQSSTPASRDELLHTFSTVGAQFENVRTNVARRETSINAALQRILATSAADMLINSPLPSSHPLRELGAEGSRHIQDIVVNWAHSAQDYERGTKFHARHGDSLLVFVYGKVKAGKSSLGNYIAYGHSDPDDACVRAANPQPKFFVEADADDTHKSRAASVHQRFDLGVTETTTAIQGFTLPGLTWVDSPGIHSMTPANGALATRYASSADIVVFLSHSSSPGRRSDLEEIANLLHKGKPTMVLLTASDCVNEDETADGQVVKTLEMKCHQDREDQVNYVQQELGVLAPSLRTRLLDTCVYPISVLYAHSGTDENRWEDSGMASLAERLTRIAQDQGLAIKRTTPLRNLKSYCDALNTSSTLLENTLKTQGQHLQAARTDIQRFCERSLTTLRQELTHTVDMLADEHAMDDAAFRSACQQTLANTLCHHGEALFHQLGQSLAQSAAHALDTSHIDTDLPGFQKHTKTQHYQSKRNQGRGKVVGGGLFSVAGAALGAALGPFGVAAGAALGGWLGSKLGGAAGGLCDAEEVFVVDLGDNRQDVALAMRQALVRVAEQKMSDLGSQLDATCLAAPQAWLNQCAADLQALRSELQLHSQELSCELENH